MSRQYTFGSGQLYQTPVGGGAPVRFGTLQDVDIEFSGEMKELFGQYSLPVSVARGKVKIPIKAKNGDIDTVLYNNLFFGDTAPATGSYVQALNEAGTIPAPSGPYTITVANSAHFFMDLGVTYNGNQLKQVASGPTTGQYSVASGVYTFAAADASHAVLINYIYTSSMVGSTLSLTNTLLGTQPKFALLLSETFESNWLMVMFNSCICSKLSMPLKQDDYMISELDFSAQVDQTNSLGWISTSVTGGGA